MRKKKKPRGEMTIRLRKKDRDWANFDLPEVFNQET